MSYDLILLNYRRGLWTREMVYAAAAVKLITREQADEIVSGS